MVRYPHTAYFVVKSNDVDGKPVLDHDGNPVVDSVGARTEIKGRYEPSGGKKNLDYSAKFFTPKRDNVPFSKDGHCLEYEGKEFVIVQLYNYQMHCEIWLE